MRVLCGDELLECFSNGFVGDIGAGLGLVSGGKEFAHFHEAVWGEDVFSGDSPGDGGGVDADDVGNVVHGHGFEVAGSFLEEGLLFGDDFSGDGEDGFLSLIDSADDGASIANVVAKVVTGFAVVGGLRKEVFVVIVDADAGEVGSGEFGCEFSIFGGGDFNIGLNIGVSGVGEAGAGGGVEGANVFDCLADAFE